MRLSKPTVKLPESERYLTGRAVDDRTKKKLSGLKITADDRKKSR